MISPPKTLTIQRLYADNRGPLQLTWFAGVNGGNRQVIGSGSAADQVGHMNLIHPMRIQVLGQQEITYYSHLTPETRSYLAHELIECHPPALIVAKDFAVPPDIQTICNDSDIPLFTTPLTAAEVIDYLRVYLAKQLAPHVTMHGVFMDVLGLGVLITGESGLGKSELGIELVTRNHGLIADDAVIFSRVSPNTIEGHAPELLQNLLEVRGLGILDIRAIFGESAIRRKMELSLIVHLARVRPGEDEIDRFPTQTPTQDVLGLPIRKIVIPVAAGRNIAVLVEAAVRNTIMQLRGFNSTEEFLARQRRAMEEADD